jgi:hypothetical protein
MSASTGPNLGVKYGWTLGESGWNLEHDNNLKMLDAIVHLSVLDRDLTAPPASPASGDRYIVGPSATGAWAGKDGQIALYINSGWAFYAPKKNWLCVVEDEGKLIRCTQVSPSIAWSAGILL